MKDTWITVTLFVGIACACFVLGLTVGESKAGSTVPQLPDPPDQMVVQDEQQRSYLIIIKHNMGNLYEVTPIGYNLTWRTNQ